MCIRDSERAHHQEYGNLSFAEQPLRCQPEEWQTQLDTSRVAQASDVAHLGEDMLVKVRVRMHHEKKVSEHLDKMGIENFVPVQQELHQWSDRRKLVTSVLLPIKQWYFPQLGKRTSPLPKCVY